MKRIGKENMDAYELEIENKMTTRVQPQVYRLGFDENREDVIIRKRKTGLSIEKEFLFECHLMAWQGDFKR
jgi:hypothetical protein